MFFADAVVLVEGISDRIFFNAVFERLRVTQDTARTCEIISVGGKGFFGPYEALLKACQVPYAVIADQDYLCQVGTDEMKALFAIDEKEIESDVIRNPKSEDGDSLVVRLEEAISSGHMDDLRSLWNYIKGRRRKLHSNLVPEEQNRVNEFVSSLRKELVFVLSKGDVEVYLPDGCRSKQLDRLIRLVGTDFWPQLPAYAQAELTAIGDEIKKWLSGNTVHEQAQTVMTPTA